MAIWRPERVGWLGKERGCLMFEFDRDTRVERVAEGRYVGLLDRGWNIGDNPNGGFLLSIISAACADAIEHPDPISFTTHYLRPGLGGEAFQVELEVVRKGRTLTTVRAVFIQEGQVRLLAIAAYSDLAQSVGVDADISLPAIDIPAPEQCPPRTGDLQSIDIPMMKKLDVRLNPHQVDSNPALAPVLSGWVRFSDERPADVRSLLLFCDTFPPSPFVRIGPVGWVPTIELTVHVRRRPNPGWILAEFQTNDLTGGRMVESGCLWDSSGQLVAQSRQIGLVMQRSGDA